MGEGGGDTLCGRRGFGDGAFVRVRMVVARLYGLGRFDYPSLTRRAST